MSKRFFLPPLSPLMFQINKMITKIVCFEQQYSDKDSSPPRDYYDPNIMLAEQSFDIGPNEEVLGVIMGTGYRFNDDTVYTFEVKNYDDDDDDADDDDANADKVHGLSARTDHSSQLCLLIKNCSSVLTVYVGYKTPLQWILDMPRITSKLCSCPIADVTKLRFNLEKQKKKSFDTCGNNADPAMQFVAQPESIVIHY